MKSKEFMRGFTANNKTKRNKSPKYAGEVNAYGMSCSQLSGFCKLIFVEKHFICRKQKENDCSLPAPLLPVGCSRLGGFGHLQIKKNSYYIYRHTKG
jgi:hypothetical protein